MMQPTQIADARDFYEHVVKPDCEQYLNNFSGGMAHAIHACMALYHMREWFSANAGYDDKQSHAYWESIKKKCPALEHARNIINSAKHVQLRNGQTVRLQRDREDELDILNDTSHPVAFVVSILPDGTRYDLREIVSEGLSFWDQEVRKLKV